MERRKTSVRERRKEKEKRGDRCVMRVELPESFEKRMKEMLGDGIQRVYGENSRRCCHGSCH